MRCNVSIFCCPVCGEKLEISGRSHVCRKGHCFDISKSGYVNLLLSKHQGKTIHGDNKLMLRGRRNFLEKGYYAPLCDKICEAVLKYAEKGAVLLDAGCGEGYYTANVAAALDERNIPAEMYGIDISKDAVELAAKRKTGVKFAAASVFHIPVISGGCDILLTMFAPYCGEEYLRVLKKGGTMIMAIPSREHLWELKQAVYDTPYKNEVKPYGLDGFEFLGSERVTFRMIMNSADDIRSLFAMTPYSYRTGQRDRERLMALEALETTADFEVLTYCKNSAKD